MKRLTSRTRKWAAYLAVVTAALTVGWLHASSANAELLGHWEVDGDLTDATGNNAPGTLNGGPASPYVAGKFGQALDVQSVAGYVDTGLALGGGAKTMVFFAKSARLTSGDSLWAGNEHPGISNYRFYLGSRSGQPFLGAGNTYNPVGAWATTDSASFHHYALVDTGANQIIAYQDGQQVGTLNYVGPSSTLAGKDFEFGRSGGGSPISGLAVLDDVAVFDNALSRGDVQFIANEGVQGYQHPMGNYVPGLVGYWSFNGDASDYAGHDGTLMGGATFSAGKFGQAISLDGINDYVSVADTPELNPGFGSFTVAGWMKVQEETGDGDQALIGKGTHSNIWGLRVKDDPNWAVRGGMQNQTPAPTQSTYNDAGSGIDLEDDAWHHLAMVVDRDNNTQSYYIDGQLVRQIGISSFTRVLETTLPLTIGTDLALGSYAKGQIDDVAMWLRPLAGHEIAFLADGYGGAGVELGSIIPEPGTMMLLGLGALGLLRRRHSPAAR